MAGKVLNMDGGAAKQIEKKETHHRRPYYVEDRTARYLLVGKDARGKTAYFIRIVVTGLRPRVVGSFRRKTLRLLPSIRCWAASRRASWIWRMSAQTRGTATLVT